MIPSRIWPQIVLIVIGAISGMAFQLKWWAAKGWFDSLQGPSSLISLSGATRLSTAALITLFDTFNRDPRIKQLYLDYLAGWRQAGGELFVHYLDAGTYSKWGRWGAREYIAQPRVLAPKFDAIQSFLEQKPVWWAR